MRTTVTLDPDVAAKLKQASRDRGVSFKEVLNASVRRGLEGGGAPPRPYRLRPRSLGVKAGIDLDRALRIADRLEDDEVVRRLALRK